MLVISKDIKKVEERMVCGKLEIDRADYKKKFDNVALGMHPGEYGMQRIAESIFVLINAYAEKNIL